MSGHTPAEWRPDMFGPNPAQRRDWFSNQYECSLPDDVDESADYLTQLAHQAEHGPAAGQEHLT